MTAWLSHPLIENLQSLVTKARSVRGKEHFLIRKMESRQTLVHLEFCRNHKHHVQSLVLRCPRNVRLKLVCLVVGHIMLLVFVLISACCVGKWDIVLPNVPTKEKRLHFHLANGRLVPKLWVVPCSIFRATAQPSKKPNKIQTRMTSKTLLRSHSGVWRDLPS